MSNDERTNVFCTQCGAELTPGAKFCSQCGTAVRQTAEQDWYSPGGETEYTAEEAGFGERAANGFENSVKGILYFLEQRDYIPDEVTEDLFIVDNVSYYREKFNEMRMLRQKVNLNWSALFFGVLWMLYRKMYGVAAAAVAVMLVSSCLGGVGGLLGLVLTVCCGLFGNYLYMMTIQNRVTELQKYGEPARSRYIEKYRGTSNAGVLIGILLTALSTLPFWFLFGLSFLGMYL